MKAFKNLDFSIILIVIIFFIAAFTSLPFDSNESDISKAAKLQNDRYDMSQAAIITVNVDMFEITEKGIFLAGIQVETEMDEQTQAELFLQKEEIVVRVADNNRMSILEQDNELLMFSPVAYEQREIIKSVHSNGQDLFIYTNKSKTPIQIEIEPRKTVYHIELDGKITKVKYNRGRGTLTVDNINYQIFRLQKEVPVKSSSNLKIA